MRKSDLSTRIRAQHPDIAEQKINDHVNAILQCMRTALIQQQRIEIRGLGSFSIRHYPKRTLYNPYTKKHQLVGPRRYPYFRPAKKLLQAINDHTD